MSLKASWYGSRAISHICTQAISVCLDWVILSYQEKGITQSSVQNIRSIITLCQCTCLLQYCNICLPLSGQYNCISRLPPGLQYRSNSIQLHHPQFHILLRLMMCSSFSLGWSCLCVFASLISSGNRKAAFSYHLSIIYNVVVFSLSFSLSCVMFLGERYRRNGIENRYTNYIWKM